MNFMSNYKMRYEAAKERMQEIEGSEWDKAIILWKSGVSLRIIEDLTGLSRSKLQRYFSENNLNRVDDIRTQNREERVRQAEKLHKMGFSRDEIAEMMAVNKRTIDAYFKQLEIVDKTVFGGK